MRRKWKETNKQTDRQTKYVVVKNKLVLTDEFNKEKTKEKKNKFK